MLINTKNYEKLIKKIIVIAVIVLLSIWNFPHTIALRYILTLIIILLLLINKPKINQYHIPYYFGIIFLIFNALHLFFSNDFNQEYKNFIAENLKIIIYTFVGVGSGIIIYDNHKKIIFSYFGIAFALPIIVYFLFSIHYLLLHSSLPWGYIWFHETHGDLAYASLMALPILLVSIYYFKNFEKNILSILLIILILFMLIVAKSRGGIIFGLFSITIFLILYFSINNKLNLKNIILIILSTLILFTTAYIIDPSKWINLFSKISFGFSINPNEVLCTKPEDFDYSRIKSDIYNSMIGGDIARVIGARLGLSMILEYPNGILLSKEAFQIAKDSICDPNYLILANAHNGWIDFALANGVLGLIILFSYYLILIIFSLSNLYLDKSKNLVNYYSVTLLVMVILWTLRSFLDSSLRDHMLEMQAYIFAVLATLAYCEKINFFKKIQNI